MPLFYIKTDFKEMAAVDNYKNTRIQEYKNKE
jgi:hypothetical protein